MLDTTVNFAAIIGVTSLDEMFSVLWDKNAVWLYRQKLSMKFDSESTGKSHDFFNVKQCSKMKQERDPNLFNLLLLLGTKVTVKQHLLTPAAKGACGSLFAPHSGVINCFWHQAELPNTWSLLSVAFWCQINSTALFWSDRSIGQEFWHPHFRSKEKSCSREPQEWPLKELNGVCQRQIRFSQGSPPSSWLIWCVRKLWQLRNYYHFISLFAL